MPHLTGKGPQEAKDFQHVIPSPRTQMTQSGDSSSSSSTALDKVIQQVSDITGSVLEGVEKLFFLQENSKQPRYLYLDRKDADEKRQNN